ncbi:MAG TPA: hypothetical protein VIU64_04125 [Polyangia bacterium]
MRFRFATLAAAEAARRVFESYGYAATQTGQDVWTDCPTLLAVPAVERRIGLKAIDQLDLSTRPSSPVSWSGSSPPGGARAARA